MDVATAAQLGGLAQSAASLGYQSKRRRRIQQRLKNAGEQVSNTQRPIGRAGGQRRLASQP